MDWICPNHKKYLCFCGWKARIVHVLLHAEGHILLLQKTATRSLWYSLAIYVLLFTFVQLQLTEIHLMGQLDKLHSFSEDWYKDSYICLFLWHHSDSLRFLDTAVSSLLNVIANFISKRLHILQTQQGPWAHFKFSVYLYLYPFCVKIF